ncbi:lipopolysaccharide heptosyltransferase I [Methylomicrobium sp. Wu6]|uniref:lipopolysaccharide heptosyltransferase I n=1 Tax=Methylomicrobium sp. Wu6 TaxID=3107928 RepID=UPI002DD6A3C8|nr:lipopolysaccharide heptosyltransferase I [Methylomicrobium sp. Wu6]MEC4748383.1 lipopolysaccharide heptosyltransferase I [Methylomicrobium sp. Wu6]
MRIAIVKLSALGDIVHAMVALQFIKQQFPECQIDWIVEERFAGILAHNPDLNQILTISLKALKTDKSRFLAEFKKIRSFANRQYDLVIDAQGLIKSAVVARLIGKKIAGFDAESIREKAASWFYDQKIHCAYDANTIDRNASVLSQSLGFAISREQILAKKPFLFYHDASPCLDDYLRQDRKNIVLVTGSTWESRNYPAEKVVRVADALKQNCLAVWGGEQEKVRAEWMAAQSKHIKAMPKLDLNSLKALIARADLLIGNDTGPTHMAWALNRPSLTIFGPTPVSRVYQTHINRVVKSASKVNPFKLNKNDFSIREIDERIIIEQAALLIG